MKTLIKILSILLCLCFCISALAACGSCSSKVEQKEKNKNNTEEEQEVISNSYAQSGVVIGQFTEKEIRNDNDAISAVQEAAEALGLTNAVEELTAKSTNTVDNLTYYKLQQNYKGIPVYGSTFVVVTDENGKTQGLSGNVADVDESISLTPTVTQDQVEESIRTSLSDILTENVEISLPDLTDNMLCIYNFLEETKLVYNIDLCINDNSNIIVDAHTSEVFEISTSVFQDNTIGYYEDKTFPIFTDTDVEGNTIFMLEDAERKICVRSLNGNNYNKITDLEKDTISIDSKYVIFSNDERDKEYDYNEATTLYCHLINIHDYYKERFGSGNPYSFLLGLYDDGYYWGNNALGGYRGNFDYGIVSMGKHYGVNQVDTIAHEYMHALSFYYVNWTSGSSKKLTNSIPGVINEAYSDIFGELIEGALSNSEPNWIHGERIIKDPSSNNYPEKITDKNESDEDFSHGYSTIVSHAAYLMTQDKSGTTKLTTEELARLWYNTLYTLPSNCSFNALRQNMLMVAKSMGYTENKIKRITTAFDEVGIDGIDKDGAIAYETYGENPTLQVYGKNMELYDNYKIDVIKTDHSQDRHIVVTDTNPVQLTMSEGVFTITITDLSDESKTTFKNIKIDPDCEDKTIYFATDFGSDSEESTEQVTTEQVTTEQVTTEQVTTEQETEDHIHNYQTQRQEPTCMADGWEGMVCECGDKQDVTVLPKVEHVWEHSESSVATCQQPGADIYFCQNNCGTIYEQTGEWLAPHDYIGGNGKCSMCQQPIESVGYMELGTRKYYLYDESLTWYEAKQLCEILGGHLVTITSAEEQAIIEQLLENGSKKQYWLGMTVEGNPYWITGEPVDYTNWDIGEPNRLTHADGYYREEYVQIYNLANPSVNDSRRFAWNDIFSDNVREGEEEFFNLQNVGFICEIEPTCDKPIITTANGIEVQCGNSLVLTWNMPDNSIDGVKYWIAIMEGGNETETYTDVTEEWITDTYYEIDASFFEKNKTYVIELFAKSDGYAQSEESINIYVVGESNDIGLEFTSNGDGTCYVSGIGKFTCGELIIPEMSSNGDAVVAIADGAFAECYNLLSVTVPDSVTYIGKGAFFGCNNLSSISIPFVGKKSNADATPVGGLGYIFSNSISSYLYDNESVPKSLETVSVTKCTVLQSEAFNNCRYIKSIMLSDEIEQFGGYVFSGCWSLETVNIPDGVTDLGNFAFSDCYRLKEVVLSESSQLARFGMFSFQNCKNLMSITIPSGATSGYWQTFQNCSKLIEVYNLTGESLDLNLTNNYGTGFSPKNIYTLESGYSKLVYNGDYVFYCDVETDEYYLIGYVGTDTNLFLPYDINGQKYEIYDCAFYNHNEITQIVFTNGITKISESAFSGLYALEKLCYMGESCDWYSIDGVSAVPDATEIIFNYTPEE